jgi:putative ATP-binding cassette transporter
MKLLVYLFRTARGVMVLTAVTALVSGACYAGLIAVVNSQLDRPATIRFSLMACFIGLALGKILTTMISQMILARFSQGAIANLRQDLVRKILAVPLRHLEQIGAPRIMVALTDDVMRISEALLAIPTFAMNLAILLGGAAYLGWLSPMVLLATLGFVFFGALIYRRLFVKAFHHLKLAREKEDTLFGHFRALTEGIKELKLHRTRRGVFSTRNIKKTTELYSRYNVAAEMNFILAQNWNQLLFITLIGLILFLLPAVQMVNPHTLRGYVLVTLYLMGPLAGVMGTMAVFGRVNVALEKVENLGVSLATHPNEETPRGRPGNVSEFERLQLARVTHSYHQEKEDRNFMIGPISLDFRSGELVFLVGGNGSGKSTLAKIITGLYPPESGGIFLDGRPITNENRDDYRQLFSAVFTDFYLFEDLLGLDAVNLDAQARDYLVQLHLHHKVKIENGAFSTTALSQGQRKRLALLTAYLEDRPFYLFDEWASDQDPLFKELFYTQLLSDLKSRGKTVLVITHDEKYFHLADRLLKLEDGKLLSKLDEARLLDAALHG